MKPVDYEDMIRDHPWIGESSPLDPPHSTDLLGREEPPEENANIIMCET